MKPAKPFTLAFSCTEPDKEFATISGLAREIVRIRDAKPGKPRLSFRIARMTRCELPGGLVVAVRLRDGSNAGRGELLGYVFMPTSGREEEHLRAAVENAAASAEPVLN